MSQQFRRRVRAIVITWVAAWPTITALLVGLERKFEGWPLALRTLVLTGLMVPALSLLIIPALGLLLDLATKDKGRGPM